MEKYKIDKAKEQLHTISSNIIMFYNKGTGYKGLNNETAQKLGLIPESMMKSGTIIHAFGGTVDISPVNYAGLNEGAFKIVFNNLPTRASIDLGIDYNNETNRNLMYIQIYKGE